MARNCSVNLRRSILICACLVAGAALADDAPEAGFDTKLPGVAGVRPLVDGGWVLTSISEVSASGPGGADWTLVETGLPANSMVWACAGGSRERIYLVVQTGGTTREYGLYVVQPHKRPERLRRLPGTRRPAAFCSGTVGALSTGANVGVTVDGGANWRPSAPLFADGAEISLLQWVNRSRLLVSDGRMLALYEVKADATLHRLWQVDPKTGYGVSDVTCDTDATHVWLVGKDAFHRLKLESGEQDLAAARAGGDVRFRAVPGGLVIWTWHAADAQARVVARRPDGTYAPGEWHSVGLVGGVMPLRDNHCLVLTLDGSAIDVDVATDAWTPVALHVTPKRSEPAEDSPQSLEVERQWLRLSRQLLPAEADAIIEQVKKRDGLTRDQQELLLRDELQRAVDKHKADGTLPKPEQLPLPVQVELLERQVSEAEATAAWDAANQYDEPLIKTYQRVKDRLEKVIAAHKAGGTAAKPDDQPAPKRAEPRPLPESWIVQVERLTRQLPNDEVQKVWAENQLKGSADPDKNRLWIKNRLEQLVAKHKADGTLSKPNVGGAEPAVDGAAPAPDQDALVSQILHLGSQLPTDEVKKVLDEARRRERDPVKQREWAKEQMEKLIAKHKADGTLPKPKSDPPDQK